MHDKPTPLFLSSHGFQVVVTGCGTTNGSCPHMPQLNSTKGEASTGVYGTLAVAASVNTLTFDVDVYDNGGGIRYVCKDAFKTWTGGCSVFSLHK